MARGRAALDYHERTKHSYASLREVPHFLDWANQPLPFKIYRELPERALSEVGPAEGLPALAALRPEARVEGELTEASLSRLLFHAAGVTKRRRHGGGEMLFRAAACTGALYHVDLYLVTGPLEGLEAGVYHYDPRGHGLSCLRSGDWRGALAAATGEEETAVRARATLVLSSTFWRNAWKYRARAYRHVFWDSGTILANLLAEARSLGVDASVVLGFADAEVEHLLGLDPAKEGAVALVSLGEDGEPLPATPGEPKPLRLTVEPLSPAEVDYPLIRETHRASALDDGEGARRFRESAQAYAPPDIPSADGRQVERLELPAELPREPLEAVIRRRGSSRRFVREPIERDQLASLLDVVRHPPRGDAFPRERTSSQLYVIANAVRGLEAGTYVFRPERRELERLKAGDFRREAAFLDLEQALAGDAAVNVYSLVDLEAVSDALGARGYRVAQLEGGLLGGRIYLAAYALGLGATGLTFYDDAVTELFSPPAAGKAVMFLVAVGVPGKRRALFTR